MILGITGGFGCGKSSVLHFFESVNWFTMDADEVCRSFYDNRHPLLMECIQNTFGRDVFNKDGYVDRKKLAGFLFEAPEKMRVVTDVIYPLLNERINSAIDVCRQTRKNGAFELPLLFETGFGDSFDAVLAIWCPPEIRKQRLAGRNFSPDEIDKRDRRQMNPDEKLERADFAVINSGSLEELNAQLKSLVTELN